MNYHNDTHETNLAETYAFGQGGAGKQKECVLYYCENAKNLINNLLAGWHN